MSGALILIAVLIGATVLLILGLRRRDRGAAGPGEDGASFSWWSAAPSGGETGSHAHHGHDGSAGHGQGGFDGGHGGDGGGGH